jgi:hypothetical protein
MFMKYHILAVVQSVLFGYAAPLAIGVAAGFFKGERALKRLWWIAGGLIALLNVAVMIDKHGVPFVTGHIINMFLDTPFDLGQQMMVGAFGDGALFVVFAWALGTGLRFGIRLASRRAAE